MYQNKYFVMKDSGTYAETLEAYGLAKVISHIFNSNEIYNADIRIKDEGVYYSVSSDIPISEQMLNNTHYFDAFPYIKVKGDKNKDLPVWIIDYESEKDKRDAFRKRENEIHNEKDEKKRAKLLSELNNNENKPHFDFDIFLKIRDPKNINGYHKVLNNIFKNKEYFHFILKELLFFYSSLLKNEQEVRLNMKTLAKQFNLKFSEVSALQIFNPHQGKGAASLKSNSIALKNVSSFWLKEYLKIIGIYESMVIKDIKVSTKDWDTKYYVIEPFDVEYSRLFSIYKTFKPLVGGNTPFKLDILSILHYTKKLIEYLPEYQTKKLSFSRRLKPISLVQGFRTAYQKKMSQYGKSIANIGCLRLPEFIEIGSYEEDKNWIEALNEHLEIIRHIDENNRFTTSLLQHYRQFLSAGDWDDFFEFYFDYAALLMSNIK
ncbi:MAG: hypothetical protein U9Q18_04305, partial [Caldisericota bacterium]|nr:hypothetical protein [Caldisericota bacterium]